MDHTMLPILVLDLFVQIGIVLLLYKVAVSIRRTIIAKIQGFFWERKVLLEHYIWQKETSYTGYPAGSRNQKQTTERYMSRQVVSHYMSGTVVNGRVYQRRVPVFGDVARSRVKYTYEIHRWVVSRELITKGEEQSTPYWPAYTVDPSTQERQKGRHEQYQVFFQTAQGKIYKHNLPEANWIALDATVTYTLKVNMFRKIMGLAPNTQQQAAIPMQTH